MDYSRAIESARRLIERYGARCVWEQSTVVANTDTPWIPQEPTALTYNVSIVFFSANSSVAASLRFLRGTDVVAGRQYGLMPFSNFIPQMTATVRRLSDNAVFLIESVDTLAPDGTPILHTIDFQK